MSSELSLVIVIVYFPVSEMEKSIQMAPVAQSQLSHAVISP